MANKKNGTSKDHKEQNTDKDLINTHIQNSLNLKCKNTSQKEFINLINQKEITFGYGCSGTGKSYLSIFKAFQLLKNPNNKFKKIIVAKPIVDVEESIGFLPGSELEKLRPYVMSSIEIMNRIVGSGTRQKLEENDFIEFIALAHIRGMNVNNCMLPDSTIKMGDGSYRNIEEIFQDFNENIDNDKKFRVESYNFDAGKIELKEMDQIAKIPFNEEYYEIETEDGKLLKLTGNHRLYTKNRGYVMCKNLTEDDILISQ